MKHKILYGLFCIIMFLLLSGAVMFLWNMLLPQIAHLHHITYPQALGLMILSRILFGKFRFGGFMGGRNWQGRPAGLKDKLMGMDAGDKEAFKEEWRRRRGRHDHS